MDLNEAVELHSTFVERSNISNPPTKTLLSIIDKLETIINYELEIVITEKGIK